MAKENGNGQRDGANAPPAVQETIRIRFTEATTEKTGRTNPPHYQKDGVYDFPRSTAEYWIERGVAVLAPEGAKAAAKPATIDEMSVDNLKIFATENGINLGEARGRNEILGAIKTALSARERHNDQRASNAGGDKGGAKDGE